MPELREVFEMTTKQIEPDVGEWHEQQRRQRRTMRSRKLGAIGVVAAFVLIALIAVLRTFEDEPARRPAGQPTTGTDPAATPQQHAFVDLRTGTVTPLPESIAGGWNYPVSPDGTMFAYHHCCDPPVIVSVANVDGSSVHPVTPEGIDAFGARWSPDGTALVYQGRDGTLEAIGNLFLIDIASGQVTQITDLERMQHGLWFLSPDFGPDGETVIFHMPRGEGRASWDLWSVPVAGGEPTRLLREASFGSYAPDGETIAYLHDARSFAASSIWLADADGGAPRSLVEGHGLAIPRWSPDGTRIAYVVGAGAAAAGGKEIHVVDVATGESSKVADGGVAEWFDENTLIVGAF